MQEQRNMYYKWPITMLGFFNIEQRHYRMNKADTDLEADSSGSSNLKREGI